MASLEGACPTKQAIRVKLMRRIAFYCTGDIWQPGGGATVFRNLLRNFSHGQYLLFVSRHVEIPQEIAQRYRLIRLSTPRGRIWLEIFDQLCAPVVLLWHGITTVVCLNSIAPLLFAGRVLLFYQMRMFHYEEHDSAKKWFKNLLGRLSLSRAKRIFVASEDHKSDLVKHGRISADKIDVALLGVDHQRLETDFATSPIWPRNFLLFVSVLRPYKNLHGLVEAYARLVNDLGPAAPDLLVVGSKPDYSGIDEYLDGIKSRIATLRIGDRVHFLGQKPFEDVMAYMRAASLFIFPSLFEGFGLPVLEAMALRVPIVCSNAHSIPEVGGDTVVYFNPQDVDNMYLAIRGAIMDYPLQKIEHAFRRSKEFTWQRTALVVESALIEKA
jgi:glycosyltransferase involved in cell wall biosynthesis